MTSLQRWKDVVCRIRALAWYISTMTTREELNTRKKYSYLKVFWCVSFVFLGLERRNVRLSLLVPRVLSEWNIREIKVDWLWIRFSFNEPGFSFFIKLPTLDWTNWTFFWLYFQKFSILILFMVGESKNKKKQIYRILEMLKWCFQ